MAICHTENNSPIRDAINFHILKIQYCTDQFLICIHVCKTLFFLLFGRPKFLRRLDESAHGFFVVLFPSTIDFSLEKLVFNIQISNEKSLVIYSENQVNERRHFDLKLPIVLISKAIWCQRSALPNITFNVSMSLSVCAECYVGLASWPLEQYSIVSSQEFEIESDK